MDFDSEILKAAQDAVDRLADVEVVLACAAADAHPQLTVPDELRPKADAALLRVLARIADREDDEDDEDDE